MTEETRHKSETFGTAILDSLLEQIAVLDLNSIIVRVNQAWLDFARENGSSGEEEHWVGVSYIDVCKNAANYPNGDEATLAFAGIRDVLSGQGKTLNRLLPIADTGSASTHDDVQAAIV